MGFRVVIVTGPRRSGKSTLISALLGEASDGAPHYIRFAARQGSKKAPAPGAACPALRCGIATATWVDYDPARAFETVPETLTAVHRRDRDACVFIEADADPNLRHAYPYDGRVFTMAAPESLDEVFRTPQQARQALQSVLHDTTAFAGEIFGMPDGDDSRADEGHEARADMSDSQIVHLLRSPLGQELASRIQCQPEYHDLVDSDVVVINTGVGGTSRAVDEAVGRLEKLLRQTHTKQRVPPAVFCCDIEDDTDPRRQRLFQQLRSLIAR